MKFQTLISKATIVLFAAGLSLTSCTKEDSLSPTVSQNVVSLEDNLVGDWTVTSPSSTSDVFFQAGQGRSLTEGVFTMNVAGTDYMNFTWSIRAAQDIANQKELVLSYGSTSDMETVFAINRHTSNQISLNSPAGVITLNKRVYNDGDVEVSKF